MKTYPFRNKKSLFHQIDIKKRTSLKLRATHDEVDSSGSADVDVVYVLTTGDFDRIFAGTFFHCKN